jgi:hypothetical protein
MTRDYLDLRAQNCGSDDDEDGDDDDDDDDDDDGGSRELPSFSLSTFSSFFWDVPSRERY